jgi:hypothetical protein
MRPAFSFLAVPLFAGLAPAQVDFLYTNISSTAGLYHDCISLWSPVHGQRPLAQETTNRRATDSVRKMKHRRVGNRDYLYWHDIITDDGWRATDRNLNGVLDPSEFEKVYDHSVNNSEGHLDEHNGIWWACVGGTQSAATPFGQVWRYQDTNNDGDFLDTGESTLVVPGPTVNVGTATGYSANGPTGLAVMSNLDAIWFPRGTNTAVGAAWLRTTPAGQHSVYLCYKTTSPVLPVNPDFGTVLPAIGTNHVDRVATDVANDTVYLAVNFTVAVPQPWVFRCRDMNNDGDANDAGEVKMFYDGLSGPVAIASIDDIEWLGGAVYVSHELNASAGGPCEFVELRDLNNDGDAMDTGEARILGQLGNNPLDDPSVIGVTVVPQGTFDFGRSCIHMDLKETAVTTLGGPLTFTFADIPVALQNSTTRGVVVMSFTGDNLLQLPGGCIIGLTPDALTGPTAALLVGGPPLSSTLAMPNLPVPAGLPLGARFFSVGAFADLGPGQFTGFTRTSLLVVQ